MCDGAGTDSANVEDDVFPEHVIDVCSHITGGAGAEIGCGGRAFSSSASMPVIKRAGYDV